MFLWARWVALALVLVWGCGDGGTECAWEGGQGFELLAASQDGDVVYLSLNNEGSPCGGHWEIERVVAADFGSYGTGDVSTAVVAATAGQALTPGVGGVLTPTGMAIYLRPTNAITDSSLQAVSVSLDRVGLYEILDDSDSVLGELTVATRFGEE